MTMRTIVIISTIFISFSCSIQMKKDSKISKFDKAMKYFDEGKYSKARDNFELVLNDEIYNNNARFYYAESLFNLKKYEEAKNQYNEFIINSLTDSELIEYSRYRFCLSQYNSLSGYSKDSKEILNSIDQIQFFIEAYKNSKHKNELVNLISDLRNKLARKEFESGRLYLKLEQYDASRVYMNNIIKSFYDTDYVEDAIIGIIISLCFENKYDKARAIYNNNLEKISSEKSLVFVDKLLNSSRVGLLAMYKVYIKWN